MYSSVVYCKTQTVRLYNLQKSYNLLWDGIIADFPYICHTQENTGQHYTLFVESLHYSTEHYTTLHYSTLHYTTLYYTKLHYTTLNYTTLHYTTLNYNRLHYTTLENTKQH